MLAAAWRQASNCKEAAAARGKGAVGSRHFMPVCDKTPPAQTANRLSPCAASLYNSGQPEIEPASKTNQRCFGRWPKTLAPGFLLIGRRANIRQLGGHSMIRQLVPSRSVVLAVAIIAALGTSAVAVAQDGWGHLTGRIVVSGSVPAPQPLDVDKDQAFCLRDNRQLLDPSLVVADDGGLKDAFVMMYFARGDDRRPAIHSSYDQAPPPVVIDNIECRFEPFAAFVRAGHDVIIRNSDDVGHNWRVVAMQDDNEQNVNVAIGSEVTVTLPKAEVVPSEFTCETHKWMKGVILIRDEPYVAITGPDGTFRIENIPAGQWSFQFWHRRTNYMRDLVAGDGTAVGRRGELTVTIRDGQTTDLGELVIPASAFEKAASN